MCQVTVVKPNMLDNYRQCLGLKSNQQMEKKRKTTDKQMVHKSQSSG